MLNQLVASERETFLGTFEERGLHEACASTNLADLLVQREAVEAELRAISLREEGTVQVSAVTEVVSSEAALDGSPEQVLQTKIVPNWQVLQHFEAWRPAIVAEYLSLTEEKQALDPVTQETLDELTKAGAKVTLIPSKLICSIKAPKGRLKARLVACGNYLGSVLGESKAQKKHDLYASGVDLTHLRMILAFSSRRGMPIWTVDIKTAFLNSELLPRNREGAQEAATKAGARDAVREDAPKGPEEYVVLFPPKVLVSKGVVPPGVYFVVKKAVYGLDQSPRDWGFTRDAELRTLRVPWKGQLLKLVQSLADECVWYAVPEGVELVQDPDVPLGPYTEGRETVRADSPKDHEESGMRHVLGWIAVYVDDILASGVASCSLQEDLGECIIKAICAKWQCSEPERVGYNPESPVRFLGLELYWSLEHRLVVTQASYAKDLVGRYPGELVVSTAPLPVGLEDPDAVKEPNLQTVKKCQQVVGELLWLSIRTRVDLCFAVAKLAQWSTKDPEFTYRQALQVLGYLSLTTTVGLVFAGPKDCDELALAGTQDLTCVLQAFTDASHAPGGARSHECTVLRCEGSTVGWVSSRQPFSTQSSCEAELLATTTGGNYAVAHVGLARELWQCDPRVFVANDNLSAITVINSPTTSWRTRHLKIRARVLRERVDMRMLVFVHVSGVHNGADIGTKALGIQRIRTLFAVLNLAEDKPKRETKVCKDLHLQECLRAVVLVCCLCGAQSAEDLTQGQDPSAEDRWLVFLLVLVSVSSVAVWEGLKAATRWCCGRARAVVEAEGNFRPLRTTVAEREPLPEQPEAEFEGPDPAEAPVRPVRARRYPGPAMTPEEGLRRRPPRPVREAEPDPEARPREPSARFEYVDDAVELGPGEAFEAAAQPPGPVVEQVGGALTRPSGLFAQRPLRLNDPPDPPYLLRIGWPLPDQPTMREIRYHRSEWGGDQSALFQAPPTVVREDFYQYDIDRPAVLVRWHAVTRRHRFTPAGIRLPIPIVSLTGRRRTLAIYQSGGSRAIDDNWRNPAVARVADAHFRGRTELEVNVQILAMQEAMRDNVPPEVD